MSTSTSTSTTQSTLLFQKILHGNSYSRRLLLHTIHQPIISAPSPSIKAHNTPEASSYTGDNSFDANVVMVLSVLLCALVCSLGLNSIIRCALRCSNLVSSEANTNQANKGIKRKALKSFQTVNYSTELKLPGLDTECAICLSEFTNGERVKLLPKCNHGFHVRCIDKWLSSHSSCPTCRHCLIETCQKIVGCSQASSSEMSQPLQDNIVQITPLEPERLIHGFR